MIGVSSVRRGPGRPTTIGTVSPREHPASIARRAAFDRLTDQRLLRAYRLATLILHDASAGEDAVHDAVVLAWTRFDELRDHDRFDAWFDRIVVNVCRQRFRQRVVRPLELDAAPEVALPDGASRRADQEVLRVALSRLTPDHRIVVVLKYLEGYSTREIAERTGDREGTVKSRLHYALRELRAAYDATDRGSEGQR